MDLGKRIGKTFLSIGFVKRKEKEVIKRVIRWNE